MRASDEIEGRESTPTSPGFGGAAACGIPILGGCLLILFGWFFLGAFVAAPVMVRPVSNRDPAIEKELWAIDARMSTAIFAFRDAHGRMPASMQELLDSDSTTFEREKLLDPWGREYLFKPVGADLEVTTLGADGVPGGENDDADETGIYQR